MVRLKHTFFILTLYFISCISAFAVKPPKREMRAVWIATVANIDWPSQPGLSVLMQQKEMVELLDLAKEYHFNTIVFQIRPSTDAFYYSELEPWSQWLTGEQGKAPDPFYDPLDFTIKECRKRGLDIHVWMNPYRAVFDTARSSIAPNHPYRLHPDWFVAYGKKAYFNPGLPETRNYVSSVVADVLRRYEIDAIHFDDYFYPYRIANQDFPDQEAFETYPRGFDADHKDDWRRDNVDLIIQQLQDTIKTVAPQVEFGISPFGVWRNQDKDERGSATQAGVTNYDDLYADILKWQEKGWIDYVAPQLYWHIGMKVADYAVLADWWSKHVNQCPIYIGHALYRIDMKSKDDAWHTSKQIIDQIELNRRYSNIGGSMFYSAKFLRSNPLWLKERVKADSYKYMALPPESRKIDRVIPGKPTNAKWDKQKKKLVLSWDAGHNNIGYVIYKVSKKAEIDIDDARNIIEITGENSLEIPYSKKTKPKKYDYIVTGFSLTNQESYGVVLTK